MPAIKPTAHNNWVPDAASNNLAQPPLSISAAGFQAGQPVPAPYFNYLLHNMDAWVQYLEENVAATVLATSLNHSMRMLGGGTWRFDAGTRVLSWSQPIVLAIPSSDDAANQVAQGSVTLPAKSVAFVNVNLPFSTSADVTTGSAEVVNLGYEAGINPGMVVTGPGIAPNTTVTALNGSSCTLSQAATASGAQVTLTFVGTGSLAVQVAPSATLVPGPNTVIIARAQEAVCSVGVGSTEMWLRDQEQRTLVAAGYVSTVQMPAGEALPAFAAVYESPGTADGRTQGSLYLADTSAANGAQRGRVLGFTHTATASGSQGHIVHSGLLTGFVGLIVGSAYYVNPATPGAITMARPQALGQVVAPVGVAINATTLLVTITSANPITNTLPNGAVVTGDVTATGTITGKNVVSSAGFKSWVPFGTALASTYAGGDLSVGYATYDQSTNSTVFSTYNFVVPFKGSLAAYSGVAFSSVEAVFEVDVLVNNVLKVQKFYPKVTNQNLFETFAKGDVPVVPGDVVRMRVSTDRSGTNIYYRQAGLAFEFSA